MAQLFPLRLHAAAMRAQQTLSSDKAGHSVSLNWPACCNSNFGAAVGAPCELIPPYLMCTVNIGPCV